MHLQIEALQTLPPDVECDTDLVGGIGTNDNMLGEIA